MNKKEKVDLLYKKASGEYLTKDQERELRKYKVDRGEAYLFRSKKNISAYVSAVDKGCRRSYYDWCIDNGVADRRRKGSSKEEIINDDRGGQMAGALMMGWLVWGMAIYWIFDERLSVKDCAIAGIICFLVLYKLSRKNAPFFCFLLPIILAVIFG